MDKYFIDYLQATLDDLTQSGKVPGASIAISHRGDRAVVSSGVSAADTRIPFSDSARFQTGCLTKFLTSLVALQAAEAGDLDLDASIVQYLPELNSRQGAGRILIRHLLAHTSGYQGINISDPEVAYYYNWEKFVRFFADTKQLFQPGQVFNYEHSEYVILGEVLRRTCNMEFPTVFNHCLFEPLDLRPGWVTDDAKRPETLVGDHRYNAPSKTFIRVKTIPYGEFWAPSLSRITLSLSDLLKVTESLLDKPASVTALLKRAVDLPFSFGGSRRERFPHFFTLGCGGYRRDVFGHNGSARGQTCALRFDVRHGIAVAVGLNAWLPFLRDTLIDRILDKLTPESASEDTLVCHPAMQWRDFIGRYTGPQGVEVKIADEPGQVVCTISNLATRQEFPIRMLKNDDGSLSFSSDPQHYTLGFFIDQQSRDPCLMLGLNAYRKRAS